MVILAQNIIRWPDFVNVVTCLGAPQTDEKFFD
jgi:hypothetical protein